MIKYYPAPDLQVKVDKLIHILGMEHIKLPRVICIRSRGSQARRTIARCHALGRIWQKALGIQVYYIIEVISEHFDKMPEQDQIKTLIHELLHIPKSFGGGFRHHNYVTRKTVNRFYEKYKENETF